MANSYLIPFVSLFPEKGAAETRSFATMRYPGLPDDEYALFEAYCPDPECDCRRMMLNVVGRHQGKRYLASISFGFERSAELAGPFLDDLNRQSVYAQSLLRVVTQILADPGYVARLESHYQMVKQAAADPTHPIQAILKRRKPNPPSGVKLQPKGRKRSIIPKSTNTTLVYQLKVTLKGSRPPIWRRIQVPADLRLNRLHHVLQTVMGWTNSHLHQFRIHGVEYGVPDREWDDTAKTLSEERFKLDEVVTRERDRFLYEYDFGDSWEHELVVEKILPREERVRYPRCLAGKRAGPPEDVGGVWGYEHFLQAIKDPENPEHDEVLEWIGGEFDPEAFDPAEVTRSLRRGR